MNITVEPRGCPGYPIAALILVIAGCNSGGPPESVAARAPGSLIPATPPPTTASTPIKYSGGDLFGELHMDDTSGTTYPVVILLTEDGRLRILHNPYASPRTDVLRGTFQLDGRLMSGSGTALANLGGTWTDGNRVTQFSISGTLDRPTYTDDGKLLVSVTLASGESGRIDAKYSINSGYWRGSDWARLAGTWTANQNEDGFWSHFWTTQPGLPSPRQSTFDIALGGAFSGIDDDGCETDGEFFQIDPRFGLWSVEYTVSNCSRSGNYSGFALRDNGWYPTPSFFLTVDNGVRSEVMEFWKTQ